MKFKLLPWVAAICFINGMTLPIVGNAATSDSDNTEQLLQKVTQRTQDLEKEIKVLRTQIAMLKQEHKRDKVAAAEIKKQEEVHKQLVAAHTTGDEKHLVPIAKSYTAAYVKGTSVITSPSLGEHSAFDGTDLIVLASSANLDRRLLQQEQKLENYYQNTLVPLQDAPMLELSGKIEGQVLAGRPYTGSRTSDIDLSSMELDLIPILNRWVSGFAAISYDNSETTLPRTTNSRLYINKAFVTVGNFNSSPFYASLGQMVVPFSHQYSSYMIYSPMTQLLADIKERTLLLGYMHPGDNGAYASLFGFKGDSYASTHNNKVNNAGLNLGYQFGNANWHSDIGASYVANIADALGMQDNGAPSTGFSGFADSSSTEILHHRVPGIDLHATLGTGPVNLMAEYVGATKDFNSLDMSFNNHGARPEALALEANYGFSIDNKPSNVGIGYAKTREALAVNLPEQRYSLVFNTSIWKSTIASIEFHHDINYGAHSSAKGANTLIDTGDSLGKTANQLVAQFGVYF